MTAMSPRWPATGTGHLLVYPPYNSWRLSMADSTQQWVPQSRTVTVACGPYFHAVRVQADIAAPALRLLGSDCGPVLAHDTIRAWWFLLSPGPVEPSLWAPGIRLLRPGTRIAVPPRRTTAGRDVRWVVTPGNTFTPLGQLRAALAGTPRPHPADPVGLADRPRDRAVPRPQRA